jgi:hypothetical protein
MRSFALCVQQDVYSNRAQKVLMFFQWLALVKVPRASCGMNVLASFWLVLIAVSLNRVQ